MRHDDFEMCDHGEKGSAHRQPLAAAEHRGGQARGLGRHEHQERAGGGLLERFEERIGRKAVERFRRREDADLVAAGVAGEREVGGEIAHLLDADLLRVLGGADPGEVGVLLRPDSPAARAGAAGRLGSVLAEHQLCRPGREPLPAGPRGFVDQQRVRHAPCPEGAAQGGALRSRPGHVRRGAQQGRRAQCLVTGAAHARRSRACSSPRACAMRCSTSDRGAAASMMRKRCGSRRASAR